jgi:hypothetical protein
MAARESRTALADTAAQLYDTDFYEWCIKMAALLRARRMDEVDIEHVAEEIEDLGKSQQNELESRVAVIIQHLLKMRFQPEKRTRSWDRTVATQRVEIERLLGGNPILRRLLRGVPGSVYDYAVKLTAAETDLPRKTFPPVCPFTPQEIFGDELLSGK